MIAPAAPTTSPVFASCDGDGTFFRPAGGASAGCADGAGRCGGHGTGLRGLGTGGTGMIDYQNEFSRRLRYAMKKREVTIQELSEMSAVSIGSLSTYCNGTRMPLLMSAIAIGKALHVSLDWLCGMRVKEDGNA